MTKFIDKIAQHIFDEQLPLEHLTIVLPSQRAKKYLHRALFKVYGQPIFAPKIVTMNAWIQNLSDRPIIDTTRALFKLYETHLKVDKEEPQTLDEFLKWGRILLSDFDEIDRYLIDSVDLFKNLADIKDIENWSFGDPEQLTEGQKRYMRFWDLLSDYYHAFTKRLENDGECYMGHAYRAIATDIDSVFKDDAEARFIFAGFNALSPAETSIMKQLHTLGRATVFVDADQYYVGNKNHEAGRFVRDLFTNLNVKTLPYLTDRLKNDAKTINIINCAQSTGQAKVSATLLFEQIPHDELSETLLLLADESLIVPVMKNIPKNVSKSNITLGLPLKNTSVKSWVDLMFNIQENFLRFKTKQIYHKDFIRFIKHPFILGFANKEEVEAMAKVEYQILNHNWTFIYPKNLSLGKRITRLIELFFTPWNIAGYEFPMKNIRQLHQILFEGLAEENEIERSIIYHFDHSMLQLEAILKEFKPAINLGTFKALFNQHWINESIAYYGNPLDGLQVMGLLETRLIDFKNMIVVGLNDGNMPPTNPIQSMIMMDLRRYHGLPTPREKQGLFAHHFYRLLHTVENCWITYSSANREGRGMDEPSRYILQLELELARINPAITIHKSDYSISNEEEKSQAVAVEKTPAIINRLDEYFNNRTSASALKTALRCSLDFYYKYVLGLGQEDKVEEEVEASRFGDFIHKTLHVLYSDFTQFDSHGNKRPHHHTLSAVDVTLMRQKQKEVMRSKFLEFFNYEEDQSLDGKNYLSLEIAQHLTDQFLKKEERELKEQKGHLFIVGLEMKFEKQLKLHVSGKEKTVKFIGYIDRIDEVDGERRIIDYKSGKCDQSEVKLSVRGKNPSEEAKLNGLVNKLKSSKYAFQLLIYNLLYQEKFGVYPDKTGIISMINLNEGPFYLDNQLTETTEELMELFEKALTIILEELYDVDIPFEHNTQSQFCDYC